MIVHTKTGLLFIARIGRALNPKNSVETQGWFWLAGATMEKCENVSSPYAVQ